jgi:hypothetical protein
VIVIGWQSGKPSKTTGGGYGLRVRRGDRDKYFKRNWSEVLVQFDSVVIAVHISESFWRNCIELRNLKIGQWMMDHGLAPWPKGSPPKFELEYVGERRFSMRIH